MLDSPHESRPGMSGSQQAEGAVAPGPGAVLGGKYQLLEELGAGGMGRVYSARHLLLERCVAIKVLPARSSEHQRLLREARSTQSLKSENVISIYDVGIEDGVPYIVMELLEGRNLAELLHQRGRLELPEAADLVIQACAGLSEAHAAGIVHRDVKPSNLFLTRRAGGEPLLKVLDFGISQTLGGSVSRGERINQVVGSPYYMSPEQFRDPGLVDERTDVWSLAVSLYTLVSGVRPFEGGSLREIAASVATRAPPSLSQAGVELPAAFEAVLAGALEKRAERRTPAVADFARALAPFASAHGRLNAERLTRQFEPVPSVSRVEPYAQDRPALLDTTATDDRLANSRSLSTTLRRPIASFRYAVPALLACSVAVIVFVATPRESAPLGKVKLEAPALAARPALAAPSAEAAPTPVGSGVAARASGPRRARPLPAPSARPLPAPSAAAPAPSAGPARAVDIDGFEILE
jgi:eukaryotic-like serine/threonine-protein kinase